MGLPLRSGCLRGPIAWILAGQPGLVLTNAEGAQNASPDGAEARRVFGPEIQSDEGHDVAPQGKAGATTPFPMLLWIHRCRLKPGEPHVTTAAGLDLSYERFIVPISEQ